MDPIIVDCGVKAQPLTKAYCNNLKIKVILNN